MTGERDLVVSDLTVCLRGTPVLKRVSLEVPAGRSVVVVGESGSGKSTLAQALLGLLPEGVAHVPEGVIRFAGHDNLLALPEWQRRTLRGHALSLIFQEPLLALNPVLRIERQLREAYRSHVGRTTLEALLREMGLTDPRAVLRSYPHTLSGGMRQRILIAMALAGEPDVVVADEPTSALDVEVQAQILALLKVEQERRHMGLLFVTHDLAVAARVGGDMVVLYRGEMVERGATREVLRAPRHPYTQALLSAIPGWHRRGQDLAVGAQVHHEGEREACPFMGRCGHASAACRLGLPGWSGGGEETWVRCHHPGVVAAPVRPSRSGPSAEGDSRETILSAVGLTAGYDRQAGHGTVIEDVSLVLRAHTTTALVGESGSGKTTLARVLLGLLGLRAGYIEWQGQRLASRPGHARGGLQMVFQDPQASLNPRLLARDLVTEAWWARGKTPPAGRARELLEEVGLSPEALMRYPHQFSGGERQRLALARALALTPSLVVLDEPTSALDVSVQAQVLDLLRRLQEARGLGYLLITHHLGIVEYLADEVLVMFGGRIVERGRTERLRACPRHPYTKTLLSAVPGIEDSARERDLPRMTVRPPVALSGCAYRLRCARADAKCAEPPAWQEHGGDGVRCHHPLS